MLAGTSHLSPREPWRRGKVQLSSEPGFSSKQDQVQASQRGSWTPVATRRRRGVPVPRVELQLGINTCICCMGLRAATVHRC
jgi:hypothetical protein